jgi:hypothetical protein
MDFEDRGQFQRYNLRLKLFVDMMDNPASVIDLGAGGCALRDLLPPSCEYTAVDKRAYYPDMYVCNFNRGELPPRHRSGEYHYVVCSGLLEYLKRPKLFLEKICGYGKRYLISLYDPSEYKKRFPDVVQTSYVPKSYDQLERMFWQAGYKVIQKRPWTSHAIWELEERKKVGLH